MNAIDALGPVAAILANPLQNAVNVLNIPTNDSLGFLLYAAGLLGPLIEGPASVGTAIQGVINAITAGNPSGVLGAIIDAPAVILGGVLNGGLGPDVGPLVGGSPGITISAFVGGILNQATILSGSPLTILLPGLVPSLQGLQQLIAGVLTPPALAAPLQLSKAAGSNAPSAPPNLAANTVTVNTTAPTAPAPHVAAPTVGSGPVIKLLTPPAPTTNGNTNTMGGGNGTEVGGGLGKIAAGLTGGSGKHRK